MTLERTLSGLVNHACRRVRRAAQGLDEIARPVNDGLPAHHLAGDRLDVLAGPDPPGRDCGLGAVVAALRAEMLNLQRLGARPGRVWPLGVKVQRADNGSNGAVHVSVFKAVVPARHRGDLVPGGARYTQAVMATRLEAAEMPSGRRTSHRRSL